MTTDIETHVITHRSALINPAFYPLQAVANRIIRRAVKRVQWASHVSTFLSNEWITCTILMCVQEFSEQRFLRLFRYVRTDRTMTIKI